VRRGSVVRRAVSRDGPRELGAGRGHDHRGRPAVATDTSSAAGPVAVAGRRLGSPRRSSRRRAAFFGSSDRRVGGRLDRRVGMAGPPSWDGWTAVFPPSAGRLAAVLPTSRDGAWWRR